MPTSKYLLTLVFTLVLTLSISTISDAKGFADVHRRQHENLKRVVRKRQNQEFPGDLTPIGVGSDPGTVVPESSTPTPTGISSVSASSSVDESASSATSSASGLLPSLSIPLLSSESSSSSSLSTSSSSSSSSSFSSSSSSSAPSTTASASTTSGAAGTTQDTQQTSSIPNQTVTHTAIASPSAEGVAQNTSGATSSSSKKISLTILIAVLSAAVGVTVLWTVFRKWKLARSSRFDKRLQPIDWTPSNPADDIIPSNRRHSGASSFRSGSSNGYGSDHGHGLPDHDFTAGPAKLAPVGGYADLARGPSPQPQMHEALTRGPSLTGPDYDQYGGVPLHHQTGYSTRY